MFLDVSTSWSYHAYQAPEIEAKVVRLQRMSCKPNLRDDVALALTWRSHQNPPEVKRSLAIGQLLVHAMIRREQGAGNNHVVGL